MKFLVTSVPVSRRTRRRIGKAKTEIVDIAHDPRFEGITDAMGVESRYEAFYNNTNPDTADVVKVIDVREVE